MASTTTLRLRRSAAQLHALAKVERSIRASDPNRRHKYLREFSEAYPSYHSVLGPWQLQQALAAADLLLVGDYHALAACQRFCARLLAERAMSHRPLVLGVEAIFARDQHILDEWQAGAIDEQELRERTRYDLDWQYEWTPFYELLQSARAYGARIYGLDCSPRSDMRNIAARDRHAAEKLRLIRAGDPQAQIIVLFGESHLAPAHLPAEVRRLMPGERTLTVLQNLDALYWQAAGERKRAEAVRMAADAICVFTATPLEKYECYRLYLGQWQEERPQGADLAPVFYNLIEALLRVLEIDKFRVQAGHTSPIVDLLPEVHSHRDQDAFQKLLARKGALPSEMDTILEELRVHGCCYVARWNAVLASRLNMRRGAELAAQFVQLACRQQIGEPGRETPHCPAADRFYGSVLRHALVYFGSRVLYPARPPVWLEDYYALYSQPRELVESCTLYSYREYLEMIDFLLLHKDYETHRAEYLHQPELIARAMHYGQDRFEFVTRELGLMLGSELYDAYVSGALTKRSLRALYLRKLSGPDEASSLYFALARRVARPRRLMVA